MLSLHSGWTGTSVFLDLHYPCYLFYYTSAVPVWLSVSQELLYQASDCLDFCVHRQAFDQRPKEESHVDLATISTASYILIHFPTNFQQHFSSFELWSLTHQNILYCPFKNYPSGRKQRRIWGFPSLKDYRVVYYPNPKKVVSCSFSVLQLFMMERQVEYQLCCHG